MENEEKVAYEVRNAGKLLYTGFDTRKFYHFYMENNKKPLVKFFVNGKPVPKKAYKQLDRCLEMLVENCEESI